MLPWGYALALATRSWVVPRFSGCSPALSENLAIRRDLRGHLNCCASYNASPLVRTLVLLVHQRGVTRAVNCRASGRIQLVHGALP